MITYKMRGPFTDLCRNLNVFHCNTHIGFIVKGVRNDYGFKPYPDCPLLDEETILSIGVKLKELNK